MSLEASKQDIKTQLKNDFKRIYTEVDSRNENNAENLLDQLCEKQASAIIERVFEWLSSNKKAVQTSVTGGSSSGLWTEPGTQSGIEF